MSEEVKPEVIKKTQKSLGKYVKKPPLTDKLLRKPPFRFLHDIISAIIKETGFLADLFSDTESNADMITDKEAKIAYLKKLIDVVKLVTGSEITARPRKIIAGQEATKTNELLQAIAKALDKKINSSEAIKHYKSNIEQESRNSQASKTDDKSTKAEKTSGPNKESSTKRQEKVAESGKIASKNASPSTKREHEQVGKKKSDKAEKNPTGKKAKINESSQVKSSSTSSTKEKSSSNKPSRRSTKTQNDNVQTIGKSSAELQASVAKPPDLPQDDPSTVAPSEEKKIVEISDSIEENHEIADVIAAAPTVEIDDSENLPKKTPEPTILEQVAPVQKELLRPPSSRPASARPAAPKLRWKPMFNGKNNDFALAENEAVIVDNFDTTDGNNDDMVVLEVATNDYPIVDANLENLNGNNAQEHGHLVAQILETQRELGKDTTIDLIANKVDSEMERNYSGSSKYSEAVLKEIEKLRITIQSLTRATHPMGKLLDFLQEDVELMHKELSESRHQFRQVYDQLQNDKTVSQGIHPLEESFNGIQAGINDQLDMIYRTKLNIMKNDNKIQQFLEGNA